MMPSSNIALWVEATFSRLVELEFQNRDTFDRPLILKNEFGIEYRF